MNKQPQVYNPSPFLLWTLVGGLLGFFLSWLVFLAWPLMIILGYSCADAVYIRKANKRYNITYIKNFAFMMTISLGLLLGGIPFCLITAREIAGYSLIVHLVSVALFLISGYLHVLIYNYKKCRQGLEDQ